MILRTRKPLLPTGSTKRQTAQRSPAQACFTRMLILQRRKRSLQETQNSQVVLSGPLLPSGSSALPWPYPLTPCFLSRPILSPPPLPPSAVSFGGMISLYAVCSKVAQVTPALSKHRLPPCACCGTAALGGLFAVHTFVSTSEGWSKCWGIFAVWINGSASTVVFSLY